MTKFDNSKENKNKIHKENIEKNLKLIKKDHSFDDKSIDELRSILQNP